VIDAAVVDASVAIKWVIAEGDDDAALRLRDLMLSAPDLLLAECGSALWAKVRRREIEEDEAIMALAALSEAPIVLTPMPFVTADALRLALLIGHPIYDCLYLALALQTQVPLVTADRRFAAAVARHQHLANSVMLLDELI
jgi:predicted nucleic acid-binding protein